MTNDEPNASGPSEDHEDHDRLHELVHHAELPHTAFSTAVDRIVRRIGSWISWAWLLLLGIIVLNVTMRYVFGEGRIEFEEIQWHIYSVGFLLGLAYCMESDDHVRVDVLYEKFGLGTKAWVELFGILFFLFPFVILVIWFAVPFVIFSISINEVSDAPGGLPGRWAIKSVLLIGFLFLLLSTLSRFSRVTAYLFALPRPLINRGNGREG